MPLLRKGEGMHASTGVISVNGARLPIPSMCFMVQGWCTS